MLIVLVGLSLFPAFSHAGSRTKTDVVYMRNGDKITGEIQSLEQGQLSVKPDYASSSFVVDWSKVDHLESTQMFLIVDPMGKSYVGSFGKSDEKDTLSIVHSTNVSLPNDSVIAISEMGGTFLKRMRGNVDAGLSATGSEGQRNFTIQTGLSYLSERQYYTLNSSTQFTAQNQAPTTNETTTKSSAFFQIRESNWYAGAIANFLSSSEQQIALQATLGGALSKRIIFTNRNNLTAIGGLAYTNQRNTSGSEGSGTSHSVDSAFAVQYSTFRFDSTTFDTAAWVYPSLTAPGHVRLTFNQDIYYKFLGDFYVRASFYDNYDNYPVAGAPANNLGGTTSVGWSFH